MPDEEKPEEFIFHNIPRTKKESVARDAEARVTQTVKSAMQSYLARYLDHDGIHRKQLDLTAGFSVNFETGLSGPRDVDDPSVYEVQLARFWQELRMKLPCILIVDTGFEYEMPGLGGITDSWGINRATSSVQLTMLANLSLELKVAAMNETTCSDIRDLLIYILGPLSHLNKGHVIRSDRPEDRWEVRLPLTFSPSGLERQSVPGDDPKDSLFTTSITLDMVFEGLIQIGFDKQVQSELYEIAPFYEGTDPVGFRLDTGELIPLATTSPTIDSIVVPSTVRLRQHAPILADWIPARARFVSDNPRIALIDSATCAIVPKRPGTFNVHLMDYTPSLPNGPQIIKTWQVSVVLE